MRKGVVECEVLHAAKVATLVLAAIASTDKLACAACFAAYGNTGTLRVPSRMYKQLMVLREEVRVGSRVEEVRRSGTFSLGTVVKGLF